MSFYDNIGYREDSYVRPAQEAFDEMCRLLLDDACRFSDAQI